MKVRYYFLLLLIIDCSVSHANTWQQKASFGGVGRHRAAGISIGNKGYMGLGHVNGSGQDISYKDWWQYDPASDSWTQKANFPVNVHGAVTFSTETKGYVGGGSSLNGEFFEYNPQSNTWIAVASCPLNVGDVQGFSVQNKGYVYLGNQLAEFDPLSNTWTIKAQSPVSYGQWTCAFATESSGFVKSGSNFYEYKPAMNQWIQRATFPGLMSNGSSAFTMHQKGYFTCGYVGGLANVTDQVWEFNPGNNQWSMVAEFPGTKRRFPVAFAIHNKGYFGTGTNGINLNDFWQFYENPLSLSEQDIAAIEVNVFPNPAAESVQFSFEGINSSLLSECSILLYSADGRLLKEEQIQSQNHVLSRGNERNGIYYYAIKHHSKQLKTGKLIYY